MNKGLSRITIDLGKGVVITAPFKRHWSLAEWRRMSAHIDRMTSGIKTDSVENK